jgi:hypothetical protein
MATVIDDQGEQRHSNLILAWYDRTRPRWIDLVGDYAGRELFLIEGDSLLRECFEDERIDFHGNYIPRVYPTKPVSRLPQATLPCHLHGSISPSSSPDILDAFLRTRLPWNWPEYAAKAYNLYLAHSRSHPKLGKAGRLFSPLK